MAAGKFRLACEYHGAKFALGVLSSVPPRTACWFARGLAGLAFGVLRKRRAIAIDNLLKAGVAKTRREARRIARASFQSMALTVAESYAISKYLSDPKLRAQRVVSDIPPATEAAFAEKGKGVILVSGHLGNWEMGAQDVAIHKPVTGVARRMNNERVQQLMEKTKMRGNFETVDKHLAHPMELVRALRKGRVLALLTDQHARGDNALKIDFFGRPAATYASPAFLQMLTGVPIVFAYSVRDGLLHFHEYFSEPLYFSYSKKTRDTDIFNATQALAKMLEDAIRKFPEQYLWAHRRWKV